MSNCAKKSIFFTIFIFCSLIVCTVSQTKTQAIYSNKFDGKSNNSGLSVILMIGDGMGYDHVDLARLVEVGEGGRLNMDELPIIADVTTQDYDGLVTDSAASATALATGDKTNSGKLAIGPSGEILPTILECATTLEKSTGLITTTEIVHATPAGFFAHVAVRYDYHEILDQLVDEADVDVIMGGGRDRFDELEKAKMKIREYTFVENRSQLFEVNGSRVLGLFTPESFPYEIDRNREIVPSLAEMTDKSLEILSQDPDGFFLMVEGGLIDWAGHANNKTNDALETIEFDKAVGVAIDYVKNHPNTILIVTADHETGGLNIVSNTLNNTLPSSFNTAEENEALRIARIENITLTYTSTSHTGRKVPFYGLGRSLEVYNDTTIDNTDIFYIMKNHYLSDLGAPLILLETPINKSYTINEIWMNISLNETADWLAYSLNTQSNVTMQNNSVLLVLTEGTYHLFVYANDSLGNMASTEVIFSINIPQTSSPATFAGVFSSLSLVLFSILRKKENKPFH
ncbi:MAG: alkaline phosphatase [Promethearchaeota archaeon]